MTKQKHSLGEEDIRKLVWRLSVPSVVAMMANALYNVVDRIFIGKGVNEIAIGGVYVVMPLMFLSMAFSQLFGVGGNTLMSISLGAKNQEKAEEFINTSLSLLLIMGFVLPLLGYYFRDSLLGYFGTTAENYGYAKDYFGIILFGAPCAIVGMGLNNFIRGMGDAKTAMLSILIGIFTNIFLDYLFIMKWNWGVKGAAFATIISQLISCTWILSYFFRKKALVQIHFEKMKLRLKTIIQITENGMAIFLIQVANSLVVGIMNNQLKTFGGTLAISAMSIVSSVSSFVFMPIFGINQGIQPILGYNYGAKKYNRIKETYFTGALIATSIMVMGFLIIMIFPEQLTSLFVKDNSDSKLLEYLLPGIRTQAIAYPLLGFAITGTAFFQAVRRPRTAMITSLLRQVIVLIPLILVLPRVFGVMGVWYSFVFSDIISTCVTIFFLRRVFRHVKEDCRSERNLLE
ncbi:MAG: MATE family efflux transporter [Tissierellia bacterium]|nr:MATE family efflux transporter [Tissierellia bacterium]